MYGSTARIANGFPIPVRPAPAPGTSLADVIALPTRPGAVPPPGRPAPSRSVEMHVLGGFRLVVDGELVHVGSTGQRLLAAVICRGKHATRTQIAHLLWPDTTSERAHANLRTALYRLFRHAPDAIHATATHLQLAVGTRIDLEETTRLTHQILEVGSETDPELLGSALRANLYDDLLPDWDDEWLADHQFRYRQLRLTALERLSFVLAASGQHGAAVQTALSAVQSDLLRDSAHEALIRAYLAQGNRHEALNHYLIYRRILRDELGLEPPASIGRLVASA